MKKHRILLIISFFSLFAFSQEQNNDTTGSDNKVIGKHEIKFGIIKPLLYSAFEVSYEFVATHKFGFGTTFLFNTDKTNSYQEDFSVTPFARFYFQDPKLQKGDGLFLEGFGTYVSGRYKGLNDVDLAYNTTAVGLGAGHKWLFASGLIIEPVAGFSQALARADSASPIGGLRADVFVGYRF